MHPTTTQALTVHRAAGVAAAALALTSAASAALTEEHFDVWLRSDGGNLVTGAIDEDGNPLAERARVFGAEFGEDPGFPYTAFEPGFQAIDGHFDPFQPFRIDFDGAVEAWIGDGFGGTDTTVTIEFGPQSFTSGDGPVEGFQWTTDAAGGFHDHFDLIANGAGGADPATGIYLLPLSVTDLAGGLGSTDTFWFVLNLGADEAEHEAAIEWVEATLVPAPGTLALLGAFAALGGGRRRRSTVG